MKRNILVILAVISVIGVVLYLLKDRLKVFLGERADREEIEEPVMRKFITTPNAGTIERRKLGEPTAIYEYAGTWIGADIVGVVREIYPPFPEHGPVLESLVTYKKGQVVVGGMGGIDPTRRFISTPEFRIGDISPYHGPYIALPQF